VDQTNEAAVKLYQRFDFELIPVVTRGPAGC
jgi:ribosomal protein S18 acetylase RimI-like enzyme